MTTTMVARIVRVLPGHDTATMLHAVDDHGLEIKLEVQPAEARLIVPGQILVVQWSAHSIPAMIDMPMPPKEAVRAADPNDHEFDTRSKATPSAPSARNIIDEFSTLLGTPRRRG